MNEKYLELLKALSDATRQEILELLQREHECHVNAICDEFENLSQPTISHHLQILKRCRLVVSRRDGKMIYYSIDTVEMKGCFEAYIQMFEI